MQNGPWGLGFRVLVFKVEGSGLRAQGSGLRAQGSGLRAQGSGLGCSRLGFFWVKASASFNHICHIVGSKPQDTAIEWGKEAKEASKQQEL